MSKQSTGIVINAELGNPIPNVKIDLYKKDQIVSSTVSDSKGNFVFEVEKETLVIFSHPEFVSKQYLVDQTPKKVKLLDNKLIGYQKRLWFHPGQEVDVFVHSPVNYTAKLMRHGLRKNEIKDLGNFQPTPQNVEDDDLVKNGLNWKLSFKYSIPECAKPGLFSLLLEADQQEPFAIPFIVSTPKKQANKNKLLVLASTNTWQSYNLWGGRSRYRNFEESLSNDFYKPSLVSKLKSFIVNYIPPGTKAKIKKILNRKDTDPQWMFEKLTIRRPFINCALEDRFAEQPFANHLAGGEWRVLAWLERQGFEYDIISGAELHFDPNILENYKAVLFSTHCEYWSKEMYEGLKENHLNNNLWIINISGNSIYRSVDFYEDGSTRCTSLSFSSKIADESKILGVRFNESDYGTCSNYKIVKKEHWVFDSIPINNKYLFFGNSSLNQNVPQKFKKYDPGRPGLEGGLIGNGASGWETDKLTATAPKDFITVAKGQNSRGGADMVIREPKDNRGGVFSASSITFGASLLIDQVSSGIVNNVLTKALDD